MTLDPDAPWQVNIALLFLAMLIPAVVAIAVNRRAVQRVERKTDQVVDNVKNSHKTNLRDDLDGKNDQVLMAIESLRIDVGGVHSELRDVRDDVGHVRHDVNGVRVDARRDRRRISEIERELEAGRDVFEQLHPGTQLRLDLDNTERD